MTKSQETVVSYFPFDIMEKKDVVLLLFVMVKSRARFAFALFGSLNIIIVKSYC